MAEYTEDLPTPIEKSAEKANDRVSSSSSDSDNGGSPSPPPQRRFGRKKPVHQVLGGGKPADIMLWRNKRASVGMLTGATATWILFEVLEYHLLSFVCHCLILCLAILFLWGNATTFINKTPPHMPAISISEDIAINMALSLRFEINRAFAVLREVASGHDLKKFLIVICVLWVLSVVGNWCNFLTLFYLALIVLHTVPVLYEKYEDQVDAFTERASAYVRRQYAMLDAKVLSRIPKGSVKDKKKA